MKALCPEANKPGKPVKAVTVEHMVKPDLRSVVAGHDWFFCDSGTCDVVYFTQGETVLRRADLTVRVGSKEEDPLHTVCYCFDHSLESIRDEVEHTGKSTVVASVTDKVRGGECTCETLNPKGVCCLGDLRAAVKDVLGADTQDDGASCNTSCCEE